ncbi:MAG: peptidoglycan DD-metalloendopeptidase family protein [Lachnospiraceae bacterium]|nr:peptidoglycan DD-metalloendopeptidase family protein [Lachnospiraceae bacterium]
MASKKERQGKKRLAQKERKLLEQLEPKAETTGDEDKKSEESWVRPPTQEEVEFEHMGRHNITFYRIYVMHKNYKGEVHRYILGRMQVFFLFGIFLAVIGLLCSILVFKEYRRSNQLTNAQTLITTLQGQLAAEIRHSDELALQVSDLSGKVDILSDSLTTKTEALAVYEEEERAQHMPTAYPLRGNASYYVPEETAEGEDPGEGGTETAQEPAGEPEELRVQFMTGMGSSMVATADGEVSDVNPMDGGGYTIVIDHGNGFMTFYSGVGTIMVKEGDVVTTGSVLLSITVDNTVLSYQIMRNGEYIDPWECMEIHG